MSQPSVTPTRDSRDRSSVSIRPWSFGLHRSIAERKFMRVFVALVFLCVLLVSGGLQAQQQEIGKRKDLGDFNLTLVGDNIIYTQATVHQGNPKFMAAVNEIRSGDAAFANFENVFPGPNSYPGGAPRSENLYADPSILKELQWIGFNLFGTAKTTAWITASRACWTRSKLSSKVALFSRGQVWIWDMLEQRAICPRRMGGSAWSPAPPRFRKTHRRGKRGRISAGDPD